MRIRNRIKQMIFTESRYYGRRGAVSFLSGCTVALSAFSAVFSAFFSYLTGVSRNEQFMRYGLVSLCCYILIIAAYRLALRYTGFHYALVMGFTALSFAENAATGYFLFRTVCCWDLNALIENPLGFEPILRRAFSDALQAACFILLFYLLLTLIPARRLRPLLLGRLWPFAVLSPLLIIPLLLAVILVIPEAGRVFRAEQAAVLFLVLMMWLAIRFFVKTALFIAVPASRSSVALTPGVPSKPPDLSKNPPAIPAEAEDPPESGTPPPSPSEPPKKQRRRAAADIFPRLFEALNAGRRKTPPAGENPPLDEPDEPGALLDSDEPDNAPDVSDPLPAQGKAAAAVADADDERQPEPAEENPPLDEPDEPGALLDSDGPDNAPDVPDFSPEQGKAAAAQGKAAAAVADADEERQPEPAEENPPLDEPDEPGALLDSDGPDNAPDVSDPSPGRGKAAAAVADADDERQPEPAEENPPL